MDKQSCLYFINSNQNFMSVLTVKLLHAIDLILSDFCNVKKNIFVLCVSVTMGTIKLLRRVHLLWLIKAAKCSNRYTKLFRLFLKKVRRIHKNYL